ncbi:MAG: vitamin B12-dependent ribonucleotide reductase [Candidatus Hydrothermarchaeales archaeon]
MPQIKKIQKRDGRVATFEPKKITNAIHKAIVALNEGDEELSEQLTKEVVGIIEKDYTGRIPSVEDVQDIVEEALIESGHVKVAKAYIIYRQKRSEERDKKALMGIRDDLKLTLNAAKVLERRYLKKDDKANTIETPSEMFRRVARNVAQADLLYDPDADVAVTEEEFYRLMSSLDFLPNSPTLMNAGTEIQQLSACFVLPVDDSMDGIFGALRAMALIHQSGGGTGFSFSKLRPKGDIVKSTMGVASGPLSFMRIFDVSTDVIKQGGRRRGANMGILRVDHPDILEFIVSKETEGFLANFNISVGITDEFIKAVQEDRELALVNPRNSKQIKKLRAKDVFDLIATMAWRTGDPGIIFLDRINRDNPTPALGEIESTNPCGELPLLPYESCNLGSINLSKMVTDGKVDWEKLEKTVHLAVHFLDNIIDMNKYPFPEIKEMTKGNRKIGLGVMGYADMLVQLGISYGTEEAVALAGEVMQFINEEARKASAELARVRGSFPNFEKSVWRKRGYEAMRNATLTTVAPTGTISIIAGINSGIEPLFAVSFMRSVMGTQLLEVNPFFEEDAKKGGFYSKELMIKIARLGSIQAIAEIPEGVRRAFVTSHDIAPEWHVRMQAAFQEHVDNAVSKTVNLPNNASIEDVRMIFLLAHELGCKGITVYRYGSKPEQVLNIVSTPEKGEELSVDSEFASGCRPDGVCPY